MGVSQGDSLKFSVGVVLSFGEEPEFLAVFLRG